MMPFRVRRQQGQGMVEYILIVALVAVLVIAGVKLFGGKVKGLFEGASNKIASEGSQAGLQVNN